MSRRSVWLRRVALGIAGLVLLVVVALGVLLAWVSSEAGGARIKRAVVAAARDGISGKLAIGKLKVSGTTVQLEHVVLETPEGQVVARIAQVDASVRFGGLLGHHLDVRELRLVHPELFLVEDAQGLNLLRAVMPKKVAAAAPPKSAAATSFTLEHLLVENGMIDFRARGPPARHVHLTDLHAEGSLALAPGHALPSQARLDLAGRFTAPLTSPLAVHARFTRTGVRARGNVNLTSGTLALAAHAELESGRLVALDLNRLVMPPKWARAFIPSYPLAAPLEARGTLRRKGAWDEVLMDSSGGGAHASLEASVDPTHLEVKSFRLQANRVDLRALLGRGPRSDFALEARGAVRGMDPTTLDGHATVHVPISRLDGKPFGPISLEARARKGTLTLTSLRANLPGMTFAASGTASEAQVHLDGTLTASNASAFSTALSAWSGGAVPTISGEGALRFHLEGPTRHPGLTANGHFDRLALKGRSVSGLSLSARVPDLSRPLDSNLSLAAAVLALGGGKQLKELSAKLTTKRRDLSAEVRMKGLANVVLRAGGTVDRGGRGLRLRRLALRWPGSVWRLRGTSHLGFEHGLVVSPLRLFSGAQAVALRGTLRGQRVRAHLSLSRIRLSRLPKFLVDRFALGGVLSADATASGRLPRPSVSLSLGIEHGALEGYAGVDLSWKGTWSGDRVRGRLAATGLSSHLEARLDFPVEGWIHHRGVPLDLRADASTTKLGALSCALVHTPVRDALCPNGRPRTAGALSVHATVRGTAKRPRLALTAEGTGARYERLEASRIALTVNETGLPDAPTGTLRLTASNLSARGGGGAHARVTLDAQANPRRLRASLEGTFAPEPGAPLTSLARIELTVDRGLGALRSQAKLAQVGFRVNGAVGPLLLQRWWPKPKSKGLQLAGTLEGTLRGEGTLGAPTFSLEADGSGLKWADATLGAVHLKARYARALTTVHASIRPDAGKQTATRPAPSTPAPRASARSERPALTLDGRLGLDLSLPAWRKGLDYAQARLSAHLRADQLDLSKFDGISPLVHDLSGALTADGTANGTLGAPKLRGDLAWRNGTLTLSGYGHWKDIQLALHATDGEVTLRTLSLHAGSGSLSAQAKAHRRGKVWAVEGTLDATRFPVVSEDQLLATASTRVKVAGRVDSTAVKLDLTVPEAHVQLPAVAHKTLQPLGRPDDIVLLRDGRPVMPKQRRNPRVRADLEALSGKPLPPVPPRTPIVRRPIVVTFHAPRNLWLKGEDLNAELGLSDGFRFEDDTEPRLFDQVLVRRAHLTVIGRAFDVLEDSSIRFTGPPLRPEIHVTAKYRNEPAQVTVFLAVEGRPDRLSVKVHSEPYLSDAEIYTLLATGHLNLERGSGAALTSEQAASIVGSLAAAQLAKVISSKVPIDVFTIQTGQEGFAGTQLEAGTYLTDRLYLGYTGRIGADPSKGENSNAVKLEYHLAPHLGLDAEYGDAHAGNADLLWSKDY